jgi:phosphoenolpyruvate synthase/pyruvate phosphate dikinase
VNTFVLPMDSAEATLDKVGGKAASLARLSRAGFPVPPGFFVTTGILSPVTTDWSTAEWP